MKDNHELQRRPAHAVKADMTVAQLTAGGALVREQLNRFFVVMIAKSKVLPLIRTQTIARNQREIPKMTTFGANVMHPAVESQALAFAQRSRPGFDQVIITTQKAKCQVDFPEEVLRRQVEGKNFKNTLIAYLGTHVKRDFEDITINGNTVSGGTAWLRMLQGMLASAVTNTASAANADLSGDFLDTLILTMPEEFDDVEDRAVFLTNKFARAAYRRELGLRMGPGGDKHVEQRNKVFYDDIEVVHVPLFPNTLNEGGGSDETNVLYLDPKSWLMAIEESLVMRSEYAIREDVWTVVMTVTFGQTYEHEPMVVKGTRVNGQ